MIARGLRPLLLLALLLAARSAHAQQIDAHISYIPGDQDTHFPLVGGGMGYRQFFDARNAYLGARLGLDYAREEHLGPGRGSASLDLTLSPHHEMPVIVPYIGVGVSTNWSGGAQSAWPGARTGLDGIVGFDLAVFRLEQLGLKVEERYGAISGLPKTFATRVGLIAGF